MEANDDAAKPKDHKERHKSERASAIAGGGELEVREMELEDLPAVFALGERVFTADRWPNLYRTWDEYEVVDFFSGDGETCFVAELDGKIVGFVLGSLIEKRRSSWVYGYLVWIAVEPNVGRKGVGSELVDALRERFIELGARMLIVDTEQTNTQALSFFRRLGFGHEQRHVYLNMNLTKLPEYQRIRKRRGRQGGRVNNERARRPAAPGASTPSVDHDQPPPD